jgi:hypothetical protein
LDKIVGDLLLTILNIKIAKVFDHQEYVYVIRLKNRLEQVVILLDRNFARYVFLKWDGLWWWLQVEDKTT